MTSWNMVDGITSETILSILVATPMTYLYYSDSHAKKKIYSLEFNIINNSNLMCILLKTLNISKQCNRFEENADVSKFPYTTLRSQH